MKTHWADQFVGREPGAHSYCAFTSDGKIIEKGIPSFSEAKEIVIAYFECKAMQDDMRTILKNSN